LLVFVAILVAVVLTILAAQQLFPRGSPDLDEVAYDAQSHALADGELTLPRSTHDPFFRPFLSGIRDEAVVFKYQPVWPALIAVSRGVSGSTLPLRALLAAGGVIATYAFAHELVAARRVAVVAALIVALSPFSWLQAATLLGYQLSFVLGMASAAAIVRTARCRSSRAAVVGGALLGIAALHRPFDAVIAAMPVLVYAGFELRGSGRTRQLATRALLGALPPLVLLGWYDTAVMGAPWRLPFGVSGPIDTFGFGWRATFIAPKGRPHEGQMHYTVGRALSATWTSIAALPWFVFAAPVVLLCAGILVARRWRDARVRLLVAMIVTLIVAYFFWWGVANAIEFDLYDSLGPFYHYLVLGPLAVLAAWGITSIRSTRTWIAGLVVVVAWTVPVTWSVLHDARHAGNARAAELTLTDVRGRSLVLEDPMFAGDPYVRVANDARLDGDHLVAIDIPGRRLDAVAAATGRDPYLIRSFHHAGDFLGPVQRDRVPLVEVEGARLRVVAALSPPPGHDAEGFLRIGDDVKTASVDAATWDLVPAGISDAPMPMAVGYSLSDGERVECRLEVQRVAGGLVRVLTPCDGYARYVLPNGVTATSREDVSGRVDVSVVNR
jgi:hypothetical protein